MALQINDELKKVLGEQALQALTEAAKETDIFIGSGSFVPKGRFDEINTQLKEAKDSNKQLGIDLETAKKTATTQEKLTAKINELQEKSNKIASDYEAKIAAREKEYLLDSAIGAAKVKNTRALKALLEMEKIEFKDNKLEGLDSQLEAIRKSDPYLFVEQTPPGPKVDRFGNPITEPNRQTDPEKTAKEIASKYVSLSAIEKLEK